MLTWVRVYDLAEVVPDEELMSGTHIVYGDGFSGAPSYVAADGSVFAGTVFDEEDLKGAQRVPLTVLPARTRKRLENLLRQSYKEQVDLHVSGIADDPAGL
jgi:hypothetical protein